jgi:hypothetical protein
MKRQLLLIVLAAILSVAAVSPPGSEDKPGEALLPWHETFPITIDFDCPRNFGFHIGDIIPLTMTLKAKEGIIVDLVNLPKKKDRHGPFEVQDVKVRERQKEGQTVYTVRFRLQCFTPAVAVDKLSFPPLRVFYATKDDWNPVESTYRYRRLFSQPVEISVSRTANYFGAMKDMKGPLPDKTISIIWRVAVVVGGFLMVMALLTWPLGFIRKRRERAREVEVVTAGDRALRALQDARETCFNYKDHRKRLFFEINAILRDFLKEVCVMDKANRPSMEIMNQLKDRPCYEELRSFVARVNQVIYEGDAPVDVESVVRQFDGLVQKLDSTTPPVVNHDKAG